LKLRHLLRSNEEAASHSRQEVAKEAAPEVVAWKRPLAPAEAPEETKRKKNS